eukprot:6664328-Lingulodinium_polyedra.AAC.1
MALPGETDRHTHNNRELVALSFSVKRSSLGDLWRRWSSLDRRGGARSRWDQTLTTLTTLIIVTAL